MERLDQVFVDLKHSVLGYVPPALQPWVSVLLSITPILLFFPLLFGVTTILERKGLGRMQNRLGPNRVGPFGFAQFIADGLKMLTKEDVVPRAADRLLHFLAPFVLLVPVLLAFSVLPYGRNMVPIDIDGGLLFFFAVGSATELSVFMAGWSSRNKYSLLGAMRGIAQMISYELPLVLSALTVVMMVGSLSLVHIVNVQAADGWFCKWHVLTPWGFAGFFLFMIAATAESNRTPFDIPEAESEIIAGYLVEYSGFKYALFFLGEYLGLFAVSALGITLFLGGWQAPFGFLNVIPSYFWFSLKLLVMIFGFIWIRGTLPRLRTDQLMNFAWKFMLPMTLINIVVAGLWHFSRAWQIPVAVGVRWIVCAAILLGAYYLFGRALQPRLAPRIYRYADG